MTKKIKFNLTSIEDAQSFQKIRKEYKEFLGAVESVDSAMICESIANYLIGGVDYTNKVCLDLGANIGGFTKVAQDFGASIIRIANLRSMTRYRLLDLMSL